MLPSPVGQASALGWDTQGRVPLLSAWPGHSGPVPVQDHTLLVSLGLTLLSGAGVGQQGLGTWRDCK